MEIEKSFWESWEHFLDDPQMSFEVSEVAGHIGGGVIKSIAYYFFVEGEKEWKLKKSI
jgi:hypothetical protein